MNHSNDAIDFTPALVTDDAETLSRPSLSYWQDAGLRLKSNTRAIVSLYIILGLILFTLVGPSLWRIDPSQQDLEQISRPPTLGVKAILASDANYHEPIELENVPAYPEDDSISLVATSQLKLLSAANTQSVLLRWQPVPGAAGYLIYRNNHAPEDGNDLGLPLDSLDGGNLVSYQDSLALEPMTYYYSIVASDGIDESEHYTSLAVKVQLAITQSDAKKRGLSGQEGDIVQLAAHPFGTDYLGRDMLARLMYGARVSLFIGIVAPALYILFGTLYGGLSGYLGSRIDNLLMRFADFVVALPFLLFMILFKIGFGIGPGESGVWPMLLAMVLLSWPATARLVRGQILQIREEAYVQAARLLGGSTVYLVFRHMVPNALGVILVTLTFAIPSAIFTEAFLSFIGMGVVPPTPSWGSMCNDGINTVLTHPHELLFPAAFISITVLAFNLLGDGLRDALDARMRGQQ